MKTQAFLAGAALAAALAFSAASGQAAELVTNGGFETGDLSGWTQFGNTEFSNATNASLYVASGAYGAAFGPIGTSGGVAQTIATNGGAHYSLEFDLANYGRAPDFFSASFGGNVVWTYTDTPAFNYTHFVFVEQATGPSTEIRFAFRNDPIAWAFDNVSVQCIDGCDGVGGVPEPGTWALMIGGFGIAGATLRRRRTSAVIS